MVLTTTGCCGKNAICLLVTTLANFEGSQKGVLVATKIGIYSDLHKEIKAHFYLFIFKAGIIGCVDENSSTTWVEEFEEFEEKVDYFFQRKDYYVIEKTIVLQHNINK